MSTDPTGANFAARLYEQLAPFAATDSLGHLWALCDGIYAMFQPVEELTSDREDDLAGWANLVDADAVPVQYLGYTAQFVGKTLKGGLSEADQREWIKSGGGFDRGRPASIVAAAKTTLTGTKSVVMVERDESAWRFSVYTRTSETPDSALTLAALLEQKPGGDILNFAVLDTLTYDYIASHEASYTVLEADFATYDDLTTAHL